MKNLLIAFTALQLLSGCVSDYTVRPESFERIHATGFASLRSTRITSGSDWISFSVERVDGPAATTSPPIVTQDYVLSLSPGVNSVSVRVNEHISRFSGYDQRNGTAVISFLAQPRTAYTLTGYIAGKEAKVWIFEAQTLRKVTEEIEVLLSDTASQRFQITPIILPIQK
jgi:hypothetical protein